MFKNPLKYQQGGQTPTQEQQKLLEAFIEWLPKKVKEFQGMQPEQIAQALDGMSKTDEGKKQLQQLMMQFQQEMQGGSQSFKQGGKIYDFVCKHAKGGKAGCGCKEEGGNISKDQHGLSSGRFDIPFGAYMKTYFNKRSTPDVGAATRRSFGYSTSDGNEYYLEGANIGRNSVDTWVNITPKKDTIIMQKLPSNHINDLEDYQMEAIMQRIRPDIKRVNNQENGGKVEKAETGMSKLEALKKAKEVHGYNNSQARFAYANAKNALRGQGLRGRELRQSAREMISRGNREPLTAIDPTSPVQGIAVATLPNGNLPPEQTIVGSREPRMGNNYDNLTFSNAFLAARNKAGGDNGVFNWRGNSYTTKLGTNKKDNSKNTEYSMPGLAPVIIEDPDMIIPEYEPITVEQMSVPMASETIYPGLTYMGNPTTINSSWPTSSWLSNQSNFKNALFGPLQYRVLDKQPRVLTVANPALYNLPSISFKQGGKVEKAQNGEKTKDTPYNGTISQGKPRSKVSQAIDNNSKARNFVKGAKNFINSPMVRLPLAGAAAYGGYKLAGILPEAEIKPAKYASMMFLSQLRPKFILDTMNPTKEPSAKEAFWAIPSNKDGGKVEKTQREQRPVYAKCGKKIKKGQFGIAGMPINPKVVKAVYDKVDNFLTPANKWEKEYGTPVIGGLGLPAYVSPVAQETELAKIIGNRIPTQMSAEKNAAYSIKAASEKQKAIDAATKAGKIYIEPKTPADWDIDLPMFDSKFDIPDLNNIIKFSWPKFIGRNVLLPASGVVGSAAAGSYIATKKDKNKKSENK